MSITPEQAAEMQDRVDRLKTVKYRVVSQRTETPHKRGNPKTATTYAAKVERETGAAIAQPQRKKNPDCMIGIDPGTHTGMATVSNGALVAIETTTIYNALKRIENLKVCFNNAGKEIFVRFEDARLRKWFGKSGPEKWKGAGSIMRDCAIWEETLTALGVPFEKVAPMDVKATTADQFEKITGWKSRTSIHAREAAWLILPYLKQK